MEIASILPRSHIQKRQITVTEGGNPLLLDLISDFVVPASFEESFGLASQRLLPYAIFQEFTTDDSHVGWSSGSISDGFPDS